MNINKAAQSHSPALVPPVKGETMNLIGVA